MYNLFNRTNGKDSPAVYKTETHIGERNKRSWVSELEIHVDSSEEESA